MNIKKVFRITRNILLVSLSIIVLLTLYSIVNNNIKSNKEEKYLNNYDINDIIKVNGVDVNYKIFNESNENNTIVLLSGHASKDLALSFEPLSKQINAKIILINRPGYAYSQLVDNEATVDYIVNYYRSALKELGIEEQVILMPHSIAGIYAMYWIEKYPFEIDSMIALDITAPNEYLSYEGNNNFLSNIQYLGSSLGFHRLSWLTSIMGLDLSVDNYDIYDDDYFNAINYLNMKNPYTKFDHSEALNIVSNAKVVIDNINDDYKSKQKLFIQANYISGEFYKKYYRDEMLEYFGADGLNQYINEMKDYKLKEKELLSLDNNSYFEIVEAPHSMYYYPSEDLIKAINVFIEK